MMTRVMMVETFSVFYDFALDEYTTIFSSYSFFVLINYATMNILDQRCKKHITIQMVVPISTPTSSEEKMLYHCKTI